MKNIALGVLGHVDVGKTSIVRRITSLHSTAALDKHPQSRERGITLDLGFSAMIFDDVDLRVTLVDCPGHYSLLRTMIAGAHIIDVLLLVVDVMRGIQQQTWDCLVIGEIVAATNKDIIIALNKIDRVPMDKRREHIEKVKRSIRKQFCGSMFESCPMIPVTATAPIELDGDGWGGILKLSACIKKMALSCKPVRNTCGPFQMAVDHCFAMSGQGTVLTGTVMRGVVSVGEVVELPSLGLKRAVKSIQTFHTPQTRAKVGDRVGLCVTGLNPKAVERGIVAFPGSVTPISSVIAVVRGTRFYLGQCLSGELFHVQIGHVNTPARIEFFGARELQASAQMFQRQDHEDDQKYNHLLPALNMDWDCDFVAQSGLVEINSSGDDVLYYGADEEEQDQSSLSPLRKTLQFAVVHFDKPTCLPFPAIGIAISPKYAKGKGNRGCHMAFYLRLLEACTESRQPRIYTFRERRGTIARPAGEPIDLGGGNQGWTEAVCGGMFKKETNLTPFIGMIVETKQGDLGRITGVFGQTGKVRVKFRLGAQVSKGENIKLCFKKYKYDKAMYMNQDDKCQAIEKIECQRARQQQQQLLPKQQQHDDTPSAQNHHLAQEEPKLPNLVAVANNTQPHQEEMLPARRHTCRDGLVVSIQEMGGGGGFGEENHVMCIIDGFFTAEENVKLHKNKVVELEGGMKGNLLGPFGKAGKCKVGFKSQTPLQPDGVLNSAAYLFI